MKKMCSLTMTKFHLEYEIDLCYFPNVTYYVYVNLLYHRIKGAALINHQIF